MVKCHRKIWLGKTNERGFRLLEFAQKHKIVLANTLHPQKNSRKSTWHSPDDKMHNQIDFILTPRQFKSSINKASTRTYPVADIYSYHDLVICNLKIKLKRSKKGKCSRIRYELDKLLKFEVKAKFQKEIKEKLAKNDISNQSTDVSYNDDECSIYNNRESEEEKNVWITDDLLDLCDERRWLKAFKKLSNENEIKYRM